MRDNDLVGDGSVGSWGVRCTEFRSGAKGNIIHGFETANSQCTDSGGNDISP